MERIIYNKTLDVHKNGIQFTLQGFETADKLSRQIVISLMASGDAVDFPLEQIMALMYVKTPSSEEQSIIECEIKDNTIIYDVLPIVEEGITEMQLKILETRPDGAKSVLATPKFAVEVLKSNADDESVQQKPEFTALEEAVARAKEVYDKRFLRMELSEDCIFRAYYADNTVYETDVLKRLFNNGNVLLSQSYARGDSGVRQGEETDNSMYYSNVSKSASLESKAMKEATEDILEDVLKFSGHTAFSIDFASGEVEYISPRYKFGVNQETGEMDVEGTAYTFEGDIQGVVDEWLVQRGADVDKFIKATEDIENLQKTTSRQTTEIESIGAFASSNMERIEQIEANHKWETVGSVTYSVSEFDNQSIELDIALPKDFKVESHSKYRYVIRPGTEVHVKWAGRNSLSGTVYSKSEVNVTSGVIKSGERNVVCSFGVGNLDYTESPTGEQTKTFTITQDEVVAEDNIVTKLINNSRVCVGLDKLYIGHFSGTAGAASSSMGSAWGDFKIDLQVRK